MPKIDSENCTAVPRLMLTLRETSGALGVSLRHVQALVARGEIPSMQLGGRRMVPVDALKKFIADRTCGVA